MDLLQQLDRYCERTGPELWSEPFNAASNLAFIVSGILILGLAKGEARLTTFGRLVILVGIGSATFHTVATMWAMIADVVPIGICLIWFLWSYLRHAAGMPASRVGAWLLAFAAVSTALAASAAPTWMNETHQYLGALAALVLLAVCRTEARGPLAMAATVFGLSMVLRTLDPLICDSWPLGTHFLWHSLNGVAFYLAAKAYVASALRTAATPRGI